MTLYYKMRQILQNATAILLVNASGFLSQDATVLLQNATFTIQIATVQWRYHCSCSIYVMLLFLITDFIIDCHAYFLY